MTKMNNKIYTTEKEIDVAKFFVSRKNYKERINRCFNSTIRSVLNLFGKSNVKNLNPSQKTVLGTVFEDRIRKEFDLKKGKLDYAIKKTDVDVKFSVKSFWMISRGCINKTCILASIDFPNNKRFFGVIKAKRDKLWDKGNAGNKRGISKNYVKKNGLRII